MRSPSRRSIHFFLWVVAVVWAVALVVTVTAAFFLARGNARISRLLFGVVRPVTETFSVLTLQRVSSVEVWNEGVWLGSTAGGIWLEAHSNTSTDPFNALFSLVQERLPEIVSHSQQFVAHFRQSWLLSRVIQQHASLSQVLERFQAVAEAAVLSIQHEARYLVVLQNTDELRATGGFMGSYTVLDFGAPEPLAFSMRDIYDPSGVSMTLPSPPGHTEYLSEGKGMKLVDANWDPDFPLSAQTVLSYFEHIRADAQHYDGVIAIPLSVVERFVGAVGGVYVADLDQTVAADQLAVLLRSNRSEFFAGSQDKAHRLQSFSSAFFLKLRSLSLSEWQQVAQTLAQEQLLTEMQAYSQDPQLEQLFRIAGLDGALLPYGQHDIFIYPVESNVGINKANRKVTRQVMVDFEPGKLHMTVQFQNAFTPSDRPEHPAPDQAEHLGYANYYRLLVRPEMTLVDFTVDGAYLPVWDESVVTGSNGLPYRQVGFLVTVPEEKTVEVKIAFTLPTTFQPRLIFQKQIGATYGAVQFSCFNNTYHSPLVLTAQGKRYAGACEQEVQ